MWWYGIFKRKWNWRKITGVVLFITLVASIGYVVVKLVQSPPGISDESTHSHVKSDYTLMLIQCILGLAVMIIPTLMERKLCIPIPNYMCVLYFVFLYCAIYLGEVRSFYYIIPYWDTILHAFSGAMLGTLGFSIISVFNNAQRVDFQLSPFFVAMFAFCFALTVGALWEIYEYVFAGLLSLNMQKFMEKDGVLLVGREALMDTMHDIIVDAVSAFIISTIGFFQYKIERLKRFGDSSSMLKM